MSERARVGKPLERAFVEVRGQLRVVDVVADPGMGKSRLLHEFRQRAAREKVFVLSGSCSPDGQQTPFLPFIEIVRGSFQVKAGEVEAEIVRKLEMGLKVLGLQSQENLGLLLNLLGLKPPEGSLTGLDGVLIGLRTRDLLQILLDARCRISPVILLIEDIHWVDSVSQEVLGKIVESVGSLPLLVVHTRRPEYQPVWRDRPAVTSLQLEPLPGGDVRRLIQTRLGVEALPEALTKQVTEKAEGNALFAEEILSFLAERGVLRTDGGKVEFDANTVAAVLPASVQSLLTARVDRLTPQDRALLQAAAVIGRRFDPQLLAVAAGGGANISTRLSNLEALDLVHPDHTSGDYSFKHALVRDALYQSLLTLRRAELHFVIAEEIERRSSNRLAEVVETLAFHYRQTNHANKAFTYLAMAGAKNLAVYSLDGASNHFDAAISLIDRHPDCADDAELAELLADFMLLTNVSLRLRSATETFERFLPRLKRVGDCHTLIVIQHHYVLSLIWLGRFSDAQAAQRHLFEMADRLPEFQLEGLRAG